MQIEPEVKADSIGDVSSLRCRLGRVGFVRQISILQVFLLNVW